ncbi:methyltransferase [Shewanella sp. AS1]|uniref:tRNA1(Val) (adenine(37)-N6)-methyltransferase n=1 Tax=Shewanella sp. AS1 TaxID=2907626 RepID=UPI001F1AD0B3|nr:methyltransferase [Shewanella sp. AS1]MCE9677786.1 methyltransferase [Shewanella sp. AS1]
MPFSFKQFHIQDSHCGMPVSTDGVVLGAWAPLTRANHILDIGAGSGLLSLMAAQRSRAKITAIEIDAGAALDCQANMDASPWRDRMVLIHQSVTRWSEATAQRFDHILCNPPYFANGPQSQKTTRAQARHTSSLDFQALLDCIQRLLLPNGQASLILPSVSLIEFIALLPRHSLSLEALLDVSSVEGKQAHRHLLLIGHITEETQTAPLRQSLTIRTKQGQYTQAMIDLTRDFYLKL